MNSTNRRPGVSNQSVSDKGVGWGAAARKREERAASNEAEREKKSGDE